MALHYLYSRMVLIVLLVALINIDFVQSNALTKLRIRTKGARNDPCLAVEGGFCQNNGICYVDKTDKFACHCRYGYIGTYCELPSLCLLPYCLDGGICTEGATSADLPTCKCKEGTTGKRCETPVPTTTTVPAPTTTTPIPASALCKKFDEDYCNTGTCTEVDGRVKCQCPPTYSGNRCEIASGGGSTTRPTGGTLPTNSPSTGPSSIAPDQYITCAQSPCNGRGTCYDNGNSYFCLCYSGYTGKNCSG